MSDTIHAEAVLNLVVQEFNLGTMTTNAEAIREAVKQKLAGYKVENYSGDRIQDAKRDKAELNAAAKRLNDARLEYERTWMKPFEAFKAVVNETVGLIKTASAAGPDRAHRKCVTRGAPVIPPCVLGVCCAVVAVLRALQLREVVVVQEHR